MIAVLRCTIGGQAVAIPVEAVREIVRGAQPTAPLAAGAAVRGLLNVRGRVVPLMAWSAGRSPRGSGAAGAGGVRAAAGDQVVIVEDADGAWFGVGIEACGGLAQVVASTDGASVMIGQERVSLLHPDRFGG